MKATENYRVFMYVGFAADWIGYEPQQRYIDWRGRSHWIRLHEPFSFNSDGAKMFLDKLSPGWDVWENKEDTKEAVTAEYMKRWGGLV